MKYKIRIWLEKSKEMIYDGWNGSIFYSMADLFKFGEDAEEMLFTGYKDWYEGDIIQGSWGEQGKTDDKHTVTGVIRYWRGALSIDFNVKTTYINEIYNNDTVMYKQSGSSKDYYYEIIGLNKIGNKFENPELIIR